MKNLVSHLNEEKIFMQKYPDGSNSDSFIEADRKTGKITKINIIKDEKNLDPGFKVGQKFDFTSYDKNGELATI